MITMKDTIQCRIWRDRLVLASLDAAEIAAFHMVFAEIGTRDQVEYVAYLLASKLATELANRAPVNAANNVAKSIAANVDMLADDSRIARLEGALNERRFISDVLADFETIVVEDRDEGGVG